MELKAVEGAVAFKLEDVSQVIVGMSPESARQFVQKMRLDPEYSDGVIKPTQRTTIVLIHRFLEFLQKMDDQKFRSAK